MRTWPGENRDMAGGRKAMIRAARRAARVARQHQQSLPLWRAGRGTRGHGVGGSDNEVWRHRPTSDAFE